MEAIIRQIYEQAKLIGACPRFTGQEKTLDDIVALFTSAQGMEFCIKNRFPNMKNIAQIEHSGHRSFCNFIANSLSAIATYCFFEKKPAIDVNFVYDGQLAIF